MKKGKNIMSKFKIGDGVRVPRLNKTGVVTDVMFSEASRVFMYFIKPDDGGRSFTRAEEDLESSETQVEYVVETTIADGVVVGVIYEVVDGRKNEVSRGHGHIIHEGALGIAQACSYAYKRALCAIGGTTYLKPSRYEQKHLTEG